MTHVIRLILRPAPLILAALLPLVAGAAGPSVVQVVRTGSGWQLVRNGQPFFIQGAAGGGPLDRLKAAGANATRTWGADNLEPVLDQAQKLGLAVVVGIWLGQERQGFSYNDADQVARQAETVRSAVLRYKDHPAVLAWGLGNEMESSGDNAAIWSALQNLAAMTKRLDPNHPTMTVLAELGGKKVRNLHRLCPDIDIVGINSYAGAVSLPKRYREAGGTKPYVVTEFGPPGTWEVGKTAWGAIVEPTSTEKADWYRRAWQQAIANQPLCLGGFAFTWGHKQEGTATWFGMLLPDGSRLGAVDAMTEAWTGKPPASPCPAITKLSFDGPAPATPGSLEPGATVRARLQLAGPQSVTVRWLLQAEAGRYFTGGDAERALPAYPGAVVKSASSSPGAFAAEVRMPGDPGGYRLFAYVSDGKGGAATANLPLLVRGEVKRTPAAAAKLPLVVYDEQGRANPPYEPSGYMGRTAALRVDQACTVAPHAGRTCLRCEYGAAGDWGGVVWQSPPDDWGDAPGGWNLAGAKRLTFWARGEKGGETVGFLVGTIAPDKPYFDTARVKLDGVKLTAEWKEYAIDLAGKDLSRIKTGFGWVVAGQGAPVVFYLDDIRFE